MAKKKTVHKRIHSRKIDRNVARHQLKIMGVHRPNKCLAMNWRNYAE